MEVNAHEAALTERAKLAELQMKEMMSTRDTAREQQAVDLETALIRADTLLKENSEKVSTLAAMKIENEKLFALLVYERTAKNDALAGYEEAERSLSKSVRTMKSLNSELADSECR